MINTNLIINDWRDYLGGGVTKYFTNSVVSGGINIKLIDETPFGNLDVVWQGSGTTTSSRAFIRSQILVDDEYMFPIDTTKDYRLSCFVKKVESNSGGRCYLSCFPRNNGGGVNVQVVQNGLTAPGDTGSDPHLWYQVTPTFTLGEWYLMVGYIHNINYITGITDTEFLGTAYEMNGDVFSNGDGSYTYKFYDSNTNHIQTNIFGPFNGTDVYHFYQPRIDEVDGTEPSITELLKLKKVVYDENNKIQLKKLDDGKILCGGLYTLFNGETNNRLVRLNLDGTKDVSFDIGTGFNQQTMSLYIQDDGKYIVGGNYTQYRGETVGYVVRINPNDGLKDNTFVSGTGFNSYIEKIGEYDGKILSIGNFTTYSGTTSNYIVRLNTDGTIDNTFVNGTGFNNRAITFDVDSNNKVLIGGIFTQYSGETIGNIIRLNTDGSIDTSFNSGTGINDTVHSIRVLSDDKILVSGRFTEYNGSSYNNLIKLNNDGSIDTSFNIGTGFNLRPLCSFVDDNGDYFFGGDFTSYSGVTSNYFIKLNSGGTIDTSFNIGTGFNARIWWIDSYDDKIISAGDFTEYNGHSYSKIIILNQDGSVWEDFNIGTGFNLFVRNIIVDDKNINKKIITGNYNI